MKMRAPANRGFIVALPSWNAKRGRKPGQATAFGGIDTPDTRSGPRRRGRGGAGSGGDWDCGGMQQGDQDGAAEVGE